MNLPLFGAEAGGLFAGHHLDVELVAPVRDRPDATPDVAVVAVQSDLVRRARPPAAPAPSAGPRRRYVAAVHQRSPLAAFVAADSPLRWPSDLAGARVAASTAPWFDLEYDAGLAALGLDPPVRVEAHADGTRPSMVDGEVEVIGSWDESVAVLRRRAGTEVRSIPFGPRVYTTALLADDAVPDEVVHRLLAALRAAYERQREEPELGLAELCRRFPKVDPAAALEEWGVLDAYLFGHGTPLAMTGLQWQATVDHAVRTYGIEPLAVADLVRDAMLAPTPSATP